MAIGGGRKRSELQRWMEMGVFVSLELFRLEQKRERVVEAETKVVDTVVNDLYTIGG